MLKTMKIRNFGCFREVCVSLKPITVLIGENDSGKSVFSNAIKLLGTRFFSGQGKMVTSHFHDVWSQYVSPELELLLEAELDSGKISKVFVPDRNSKSDAVCENVFSVGFIELPSGGPRMSMGKQLWAQAGRIPRFVHLEGNGVTVLLEYFYKKEIDTFREIEESLRSFFNDLKNLKFSYMGTMCRIDAEFSNGKTLPLDLCSSGIRILLYFLTLKYFSDLPEVLVIENPDFGICEEQFYLLSKIIRGLLRNRDGVQTQVIFTTHSSYLLDHVNLAEDQVLIFLKDKMGERYVKEINRGKVSSHMHSFSLGEVLSNEGFEFLSGE